MTCNVIVIDNYDSFTFNLVDSLKKQKANVIVYRNSAPLDFIIDQIKKLEYPKCLILSPGPGNPQQAGICLDLIKATYRMIPILGICLGHQSIGEAFGGKLDVDVNPFHGKVSTIEHEHHPLFSDLPSPMEVGRYHSLYVKELPSTLKVIATHQGMIMGLAHQHYPVYGLQFHPESILTPYGDQIIENFMKMTIALSSEVNYALA
ncbi:MAG: anthranilate synthase component II [Candidatus Berkiellales bacterium]